MTPVNDEETYEVEEKNDKDIELLQNKIELLEVLIKRLGFRVGVLEAKHGKP